MAIQEEHGTLIGQNMDLGRYTDGHQIVMQIDGGEGHDPSMLIFSVGCMIGLMGVSERLGVCVNALPQLRAASEGLPVAFVLRLLLASRDLSAAIALLRSLPHATGQHYLLADGREIRSFEASPDGVFEYRGPDRRQVLHTNHPLTDIATVGPAAADWMDNSTARLQSLSHLAKGAASLAAIQAALSACDHPDHPVSRAIRDGMDEGIGFTAGSMISTLAPGSPVESWVSDGPPHLRPYRRVALT